MEECKEATTGDICWLQASGAAQTCQGIAIVTRSIVSWRTKKSKSIFYENLYTGNVFACGKVSMGWFNGYEPGNGLTHADRERFSLIHLDSVQYIYWICILYSSRCNCLFSGTRYKYLYIQMVWWGSIVKRQVQGKNQEESWWIDGNQSGSTEKKMIDGEI